MLKAGIFALAVVVAAPAAAAPGAVAGALELDFGTSDAEAADAVSTTHLDLAAEVPLNTDFAIGIAASNSRKDQSGALNQTLALGLAPSWHLSEELRMGAYFERHRLGLETGAPQADAWGIEAGYRPSEPVLLTGYYGRFDGADAGAPENMTWGISARTALSPTYMLFAFFQRDVSGGAWWQGRGAGLNRKLDDRGLGLSVRYSEREASGGALERTLFFGGTIAVGKARGSSPEFRARHCVSCAPSG